MSSGGSPTFGTQEPRAWGGTGQPPFEFVMAQTHNSLVALVVKLDERVQELEGKIDLIAGNLETLMDRT